jgi:hypothetical protein
MRASTLPAILLGLALFGLAAWNLVLDAQVRAMDRALTDTTTPVHVAPELPPAPAPEPAEPQV